MKTLEALDDKVLYKDLNPFLYLDDAEQIRFGCVIRFRGRKGQKSDESKL